MRHGEAEFSQPDAERRLTSSGEARVDGVAARAAARGMQADYIYHSNLVRAAQTAAILARHLGAKDRLEMRAGLAPDAPVEPVARCLRDLGGRRNGQRIVLVGHLPFLGHLAAWLLGADAAAPAVAFAPGTLVKLVPGGCRHFSLAWVLKADAE